MPIHPLTPANIEMSTEASAPFYCIQHRKACVLYADGTIWCNDCDRAVRQDEVRDKRRGRTVTNIQPNWKAIPVD